METKKEGRAVGGAMVAAAALVLLAMGHHPSGAHGGGLAGIVHGAMMALLMVLAWGFASFARMRGAGRPIILAGSIAYGVSLIAHFGAATINGFIVPALAGSAQPVGHDIFRLAWESNQALARIGVYLTGAAYLFWSADLIAGRSASERLTGLAGLAAGAIPIILLALGVVRMDVSGAFLVYALHVGWAALAGLMLIRGGLDRAAAG